jgi:hypothetical protein
VQLFFAVRAWCCAWKICLCHAAAHGKDLLDGNGRFSRSAKLLYRLFLTRTNEMRFCEIHVQTRGYFLPEGEDEYLVQLKRYTLSWIHHNLENNDATIKFC